MKKILYLILTLSLVMVLGSVSFAANGDTDIKAPAVPGAPIVNAVTVTYVELPDENTAGGSANKVTPGGDVLPKTGGIPAETFYVAGALFIVAAVVLSRKKVKESLTGNK